jgi:hypothetical protein
MDCNLNLKRLAHLYCDAVPNLFDLESPSRNSLFEVHFWEAFLLTHGSRISQFLSQRAYDHGPFACEKMQLGRTCYRFTYDAWTGHAKKFFIENRIQVTIKVTKVDALEDLTNRYLSIDLSDQFVPNEFIKDKKMITTNNYTYGKIK